MTASLLSFMWPGLGQAYLRHARRAVAFALPPAVLVGIVVATYVTDPSQFLRFLAPGLALAAIALLAIHAIWRVLAIVDAWLVARSVGRRASAGRTGSAAFVIVLCAIMVAAHAAGGSWFLALSDAAKPISNPQSGSSPIDEIIGPAEPGSSGAPPIVPLPPSGPIQVLFVGVDSGPSRGHSLTDSLMVVSYQTDAERLAMVSIPRDTGRLPFYAGGVYNARINSLLGKARRDPERFPDGPIGTLVNEISYIVGVPIQYYAVVDMAGFAETVDMVGGVDVNVLYPIADDHHRFYLDAGRQHLDGRTALLYARSRYGPNNNDWQRARRQQDLLRALVARTRNPAVVLRAPEIVAKLADMVRTNVPLDQLSDVLDLLARSDKADAQHYVLRPNKYASRIPPGEVGGRYMTELKMDVVAALSIELWGSNSRYAASSNAP